MKHDIAYIKDRNCFPWIEDVSMAQTLMDKQLHINWANILDGLVVNMCPDLPELLPLRPDFYWSADETEWAHDIMFRSVDDLSSLYPSLIYHGMQCSNSASVMRYFGCRNISLSGKLKGKSPREIRSDYRRRYEGVRIKHWKDQNFIKMYNKSGSS